jgi:hypothetical protein
MTSALVQPRVDLAHVVLPSTLAQRHETQWFRIKVWVRTKDIKHDMRGRSVVAGTNDVAITDDQN